jgi:hypothetical protein
VAAAADRRHARAARGGRRAGRGVIDALMLAAAVAVVLAVVARFV